jgi:hypothetical protein
MVHIQRRRLGSYSAALPAWAADKFTDSQAAVMKVVGIEMLNKRGVCALYLKVIAATANVGIEAAREALKIADTIDLVTIEHLRGFYNIRIRSPDWLPALRERIEKAQNGAASEAAEGEAVTKAPINQSITNPTFTRRIEEKASERRSGFSLEFFASCAWTKRPCF